jgi:hypothetical protein
MPIVVSTPHSFPHTLVLISTVTAICSLHRNIMLATVDSGMAIEYREGIFL